MDFLKILSPKMLLGFLPMILIKVGNSLQNKDDNDTGTDDELAKIVFAAAPAVEAFESNNQSAFRKSLEAVYAALGKYLGKQ